MGMCPYCAQTETKKDKHGYCKEYSCFSRSGIKDKESAKLGDLIKRAQNLILIPKHSCGQIGMVVTNHYNKRTREANNIMIDAKREWGYVPAELLMWIPEENRRQWDKNIRW